MSFLVAYDASDPAREALECALDTFTGEDVTVLHVINPVDAGTADEMLLPGMENYRAELRERAEELLDEARKTAEERGVDVETETTVGAPDREIVRFATENDIDHIVIGSHGRQGASRVLLGSVAETVVRRSSVPVTVVR
jgi:nucleotide-binding universal stress UspA family protein